MPKIAGIVAEYNPFHNGHALHIQRVREGGAAYVAAVMSGNFVQRGEPALLPKEIRARAAVEGGCDLVVELPAAYALSTAQRFGAGAVGLLLDLGVNMLSFGCETADLPLLLHTAKTVAGESWVEHAKKRLREGASFPAARSLAVGEIAGEASRRLLEEPNNLLGVEYLCALLNRNFCSSAGERVEVLPIARMGAAHDVTGSTAYGRVQTASGTFLRELARLESLDALVPFVPEQAMKLYSGSTHGIFRDNSLDLAVLSRLRTLAPTDFRLYADCTEGLEHRMYEGVQQAGSLEELFTFVKTKRYPLSRIRRLVWCAGLGLTADFVSTPPPYLRILAMGKRGGELLSVLKPARPLSHSLKRLSQSEDALCARFARTEAAVTDFYGLGFSPVLPRGADYRIGVK